MPFTEPIFAVFMAALILALLLVRGHRRRKLLLLVASYYFYAYWDWRFLGLLFASTAANYGIGLALERSPSTRARGWLLAAALVFNLAPLAFFKYANFFLQSFAPVTETLGLHPRALHLVLPLGISFYTFHSLSYALDVHRGKLPACRSLLDFALFLALFPQLVAGPIVRAAELLPQFNTPRGLSWDRAYRGFQLFTLGLVKKALIADRVGPFVGTVFDAPGHFSGPTTWLAVLGYAAQIYCDFSGYSDMATGVACALGYDFPRNFDHPYLARRLDLFWRRWHITLSSWLRDYVYIPLGGNRRGTVRTYLNLFATMVIGGLWHGASWTFVVWGAIHGAGLVLVKFLHGGGKDRGEGKGSFLGGLEWVFTLVAVCVGWVFFRASSFGAAALVIRQMFSPRPGIQWLSTDGLIAVAVVTATHMRHVLLERGLLRPLSLQAPTWYALAILFALWWLAFVYYPMALAPFIYARF